MPFEPDHHEDSNPRTGLRKSDAASLFHPRLTPSLIRASEVSGTYLAFRDLHEPSIHKDDMKSGVLFLAALLLSTISFAAKANADDLLADACVAGGPIVQSASLSPADFRNVQVAAAYADVDMYSTQELAFRMPKLTCDDLRNAQDAAALVSIVLSPVKKVLALPIVGEQIAAGLAVAGVSAPAVATVSVIGATGMAVFYIIMRKQVSDCEKENQAELKRQFFNELESKYGIHASPSQQIQYQH